MTSTNSAPSAARMVGAWSVHTLTASGALWGLLAVLCIAQSEFREALLFMIVAIAVDSVDGMLARWVRVKETMPWFDGALLDNLVDYLNYVFVPAVLVGAAGALFLYFGLKAVHLTEMANRVWKRAAEFGLILAERRRLGDRETARSPAGEQDNKERQVDHV